MIQKFKNLTVVCQDPTNAGYFLTTETPNGARRRLAYDSRYHPVMYSSNRGWTSVADVQANASTPIPATIGAFGESFGVDNVPTQVVQMGIVPVPTNIFKEATSGSSMKAGEVIILKHNSTKNKWELDVTTLEGTTTGLDPNNVVGILMEKVTAVTENSTHSWDKKEVEVLVGTNPIPRTMTA